MWDQAQKDLCEGVDFTKPPSRQNRWRWYGGPKSYKTAFCEFKRLSARATWNEYKMVRQNAGQWMIKYRARDE